MILCTGSEVNRVGEVESRETSIARRDMRCRDAVCLEVGRAI